MVPKSELDLEADHGQRGGSSQSSCELEDAKLDEDEQSPFHKHKNLPVSSSDSEDGPPPARPTPPSSM